MDKDQVISALKRQILSLEMKPGEAVDETQLASTFAISRTPLREVVQRLAGEGYLVLEKNRGSKVAPMDLSTLREFFQAAPMIYAAISRLAAERASREQIATLKEIQSHYRKAVTDNDVMAAALNNHAFHAQIGVMAATPYLSPSLDRLLIDHTRIGQTFYRPQTDADRARISEAAAQHDAMIEAIAAHRPAEAVELTLRHWDLSRDRMERFVAAEPLEYELAEPVQGRHAHAV